MPMQGRLFEAGKALQPFFWRPQSSVHATGPVAIYRRLTISRHRRPIAGRVASILQKRHRNDW